MHRSETLRAPVVLAGGVDSAMSEQEFRVLYDATARPILSYLIGVTGRRDVAEDLLQETYCRFLARGPRSLAGEEARRYLFRVAGNLMRDRWRRGEDSRWVELVDAGAASNAGVSIDVQRAMSALKPRERELLWLAYVEGMSHAEIAAATGLAAMSVRLLLFRARRRAAALLGEESK